MIFIKAYRIASHLLYQCALEAAVVCFEMHHHAQIKNEEVCGSVQKAPLLQCSVCLLIAAQWDIL